MVTYLRYVGAVSILGALAFAAGPVAAREKEIFDAMLYLEKPDLSRCGIRTIHVVYEQFSGIKIAEGASTIYWADFEQAATGAARAAAEVVVLDIEALPAKPWSGLAAAVGTFRRKVPGKRLGVYGVLPPVRYWEVMRSNERRFGEREHAEIGQLAQEVDALFPSLYVHYEDIEGWQRFARETIRRAQQYRKAVFPFVWPQFHPGNKTRGLDFLPAHMWRVVVETVLNEAEGMVLWGGWRDKNEQRLKWDERAEWWAVTAEILRRRGWEACAGGK